MMGVLLFSIVLLIISFENGYSQYCYDSIPSMKGRYKICSIDSIESVYIIYAQRSNPLIKIVSPKIGQYNYDPIKVGEYYDLELCSYIPYVASKLHIGGVKIAGVLVRLEGDKVLWDLYNCHNMNGLCIDPIVIPKKWYEQQ